MSCLGQLGEGSPLAAAFGVFPLGGDDSVDRGYSDAAGDCRTYILRNISRSSERGWRMMVPSCAHFE